MDNVYLDVSELAAPEPMRVILNALTGISRGQTLVVRHRQEPKPLYPKLIELGFSYQVQQSGSFYLINIKRRD